MTQASSHLVNKLAYIFFSRKLIVISKNKKAIISVFTKYHTQKLLIKFQTLNIKKNFIERSNNTLQQLYNTLPKTKYQYKGMIKNSSTKI